MRIECINIDLKISQLDVFPMNFNTWHLATGVEALAGNWNYIYILTTYSSRP